MNSRIKVGCLVDIQDEVTGKVCRGYVEKYYHNNNEIVVHIDSGEVGFLNEVLTVDKLKRENFKFYNALFSSKSLYSFFDNETKKYAIYQEEANTYASLYEDKTLADKTLLKVLETNKVNWSVRALPKNKVFIHVFQKAGATHLRINNMRQIPLNKLDSFYQRVW